MQLLQNETLELELHHNGLGSSAALALATVHPHAEMHTVQVRSKRFSLTVRVESDR